jgi:hypothetical protein
MKQEATKKSERREKKEESKQKALRLYRTFLQ